YGIHIGHAPRSRGQRKNAEIETVVGELRLPLSVPGHVPLSGCPCDPHPVSLLQRPNQTLTIVVDLLPFRGPLFEGDRTMRRILSLQGLAVAVWVSFLAFEGLLTGMAAVRAWHPHFLPVMPMLALLMVAGLALLVGASWRVIRGPGRGRALSSLLIGV